MIGVMLYKQSMTNAAKDWPSAPGKILGSRISYSNSTNKMNPSPWVTYAYDVNGKTYEGSVILPGWISESGREYSEAIVARYPRCTEVTVYFNPRNPEQACLEKYSLYQTKDWAILIAGNLLMPFVVLLYKLFSGC
jgi:hypothetical protein